MPVIQIPQLKAKKGEKILLIKENGGFIAQRLKGKK